jgi:hypothetical protein
MFYAQKTVQNILYMSSIEKGRSKRSPAEFQILDTCKLLDNQGQFSWKLRVIHNSLILVYLNEIVITGR